MTTLLIVLAMAAASAVAQPGARPSGGEETEPAPAYVRRGDPIEARYQAYRQRLETFYERFIGCLGERAPDLEPAARSAPPRPVRYGYAVVPRIVPDPPQRATAARAKSNAFSWSRTESFIERDRARLDRLEERFRALRTIPADQARPALQSMLDEYLGLSRSQTFLANSIQYNRFWQADVARARAFYEEGTRLHDAVLEHQAVLDALQATDESAFRKALAGITGLDGGRSRA